ncbi:MAG: hypothetical protein K8L91_21090 [Anaerolineae bacterium]|nr:hypothetical protein [Anaerolineae bacterium]
MSTFRWSHLSWLLLLCSFVVNGVMGTHAQTSTPQIIESDAPEVGVSGHWQNQATNQASGGGYRYSSGAESDALTLVFEGTTLEVVYVAGPRLGTLAIEVDGTVLRTVITTAEQTAYAQLARIDYLSNDSHTLKVYAQEGGVVAIDAFVIPTPSPSPPSGEGNSSGETRATTCAPVSTIMRASVTETGAQSTGDSFHVSLSSDGRFVTFDSTAPLAAGDGDTLSDIYVYDRQTCAVQFVSISSANQKGNGHSFNPAISADGRYVTFDSLATNLVQFDNNGLSDIFVHDRQTATTTRVSVATGGTQATGGGSLNPTISADGRFVAFESSATNLVGGDSNGLSDIFVHDRNTTSTTRVSVATGGTQATGGISNFPAISGNGRFVTFHSGATNLVGGDTNGLDDIFVHDRNAGTTARVSVATGGTQQLGGGADFPVISSDGRYVAFQSFATNLVAGDTNGVPDVFVHDRNTIITTRVSVATGGTQSSGGGSFVPGGISADGRYVAFESDATNLVAGDTNARRDIFVHDRQITTTTRVSIAANGTQGNGGSENSALSSDGRYVAFDSDASTLVAGDTNARFDIFGTPRVRPGGDSLALFNPTFQFVALLNTVADNPPASAYTAFSAYAPVTGGTWVTGDWNADGLDTLGLYRDGAFYFTNKSGESQSADWRGLWIGILGPVVSGRFSNASANDCVGAVDSALQSGVTVFALYFTCDMSGTTLTPALTFQWLSAPLPNPTFTGTFQFSAGDFNGDGLDSVAVRRNEFIAFGNVAPAAGPAIYDLAQYIGVPGTGDNGSFVVGDWDGNGLDSFGLFYQNGELFYRNDLDFNSGVYLNQSVGTPFGNIGVQAATWR